MGILFKRLTTFFSTWPLYVLLLPIFFIANIYTRYGKFLETNTAVRCFLLVFCSVLILYLLINLLYKNKAKAGVLTLITAGSVLYFGDIKNAVGKISFIDFIGRYTFFLPLFLLILIFIFFRLRKKNIKPEITLLLNTLLVIYIAIEIGKWISLNQQPDISLPSTYNSATSLKQNDSIPQKPNIIYIVPDCYPSLQYQKEILGKNSYYLDSSLKRMGFFVIEDGKSNANRTPFSMAATFQMEYPAWLTSNTTDNPHAYNKAVSLVKNASIFQILTQYSYRFFNLSNLDIADEPALKKSSFLTMPTEYLIFYNTLPHCLQRELLWRYNPLLGITEEKRIIRNKSLLGYQKNYTQKLYDSIKALPLDKKERQPAFVYAHLLMPHFPYFFDSSGNANPDKIIFGTQMVRNKTNFKNYIGYTDLKLTALLQSLLDKFGSNSIIILQSDHGIADLDSKRKEDAFSNYSAFYFPDGDYKMLYRGMSNINTFRIVLNKYFGQQLPMLKDYSIYVDK